MRAIITGAQGFVGSYLLEHLRSLEAETLAVDLPACDVTDITSISRMVRRFRPDIAFHLAARASVGASKRNPHLTWQTNILGTSALLEAVRRETPLCRVIVVSSASVYGSRPGGVLGEEDQILPKSPYASSKVATELIARSYVDDFSLAASIVRPFNLVGPRQSLEYSLPSLADRLIRLAGASDCRLEVSNLDAVRDFVDVRDAVKALISVALHGEVGEAYNVCSGEGTTIRTVVEEMADLIGLHVEIVERRENGRIGECTYLVGDPRKIQAIDGWAPTIPLKMTLRDIIADVRHNGNQD